MQGHEYFQKLAQYNRWMNERIYEVCGQISDGERKKDCGAFFRSIHGTLNHLLLGDRFWLGQFKGRPFAVRSLDQELYSEFDALRRERKQTDAELITWTDSLTDEKLASAFTLRLPGDQERIFPLWFLALHSFNHETHHRGQLTTLLTQRGHEPGVTDLLFLPGAELGGHS